MASLSIRGVEKSFGRAPALSGIDLEVQDGDFCVLIGPPGCGKSTLLRAIAGLEMISAGTVEIDGQVVNPWPPRDRNIAMVFQNDALFPTMSAYNNIAFGLKAQKVPRAEIETRVRRFADLVGVADLLTLRIRQLPAEARQLVAIGRALVRDAGLCLFDDPLVTLDAQPRETMRGEIKRLHRQFAGTKIYVTRDPVEAMTLADRIAFMHGGKIEQEGAPLDLFERPATRFVAGFFGSPPMNFLPGSLSRAETGDVVRLGGEGVSVPLPPNRLPKSVADGLPVILGVRPEHMMRAVRVSPQDGTFRHDAEVELLQPIGSRTYVTFALGGVPVVAELQAHDASRPGDRIPIDINLKRASVFNATTGRAL